MLKLYDKTFASRLILGTALYPSPQVMLDAVAASECALLTVSLRRQAPQQKAGQSFWQLIQQSGCQVLANTAGCLTVQEAVTTAEMARELFKNNWIKLELIGDDYTLQPDPFKLVEATEILIKAGFKVLPYCTDDLVVAKRLVDLGCEVIMPWGSPIGSGQGLLNPFALETLRNRLPEITLIVDAGIGRPSDALMAMELGYDAVILNTAVAQAGNPVAMAKAFKHAVIAGRLAYESTPRAKRSSAQASTPVLGTPFWQASSG